MAARCSFVVLLVLVTVNDSAAQTQLRGWYADGQTWLVWKDDALDRGTYRIFGSTSEITDLSAASMIGRLFPEDWRAVRLKQLDPDLTWTIPDGLGGRYRLADDEALFVHTPQTAGPRYFAVAAGDSSEVGPENATGPITQSLDPVQCHLQREGETRGRSYRIFAHWINGRPPDAPSRADYPVMGNEHFNGVGMLFRVWEPPGGRAGTEAPATLALHGGAGAYFQIAPVFTDGAPTPFHLDEGLLIAPDDAAWILLPSGVRPARTFWFGYREGYDRFRLPGEQPAPDDALIADYTLRRLIWMLGWLTDAENLDPTRISVMGFSMGARGVSFATRVHPELFSAGVAFAPGIGPLENNVLHGRRAQGLRTSLPGRPMMEDLFNPAVALSSSERDMPFTRLLVGRADATAAAGWSPERTAQLHELNNAAYGHRLYWDERGHRLFQPGAHWEGSPGLTAQGMTRYRSNGSFPAFFNDDQDPTAEGRQPDPGDGDPAVGAPWGTWSGYYDWDLETIDDVEDRWAATVFLVSDSSFPADVPAFSESTADIAIRRPQQFRPLPHSEVEWTLVDLADGTILQSGSATVRGDGLTVIAGLTISKSPARLHVVKSGVRPVFSAESVLCAAGYASGRIAPGEIVVVFGANMGPTTLLGGRIGSSGRIASSLDGSRVVFDGAAAPFIYTQDRQLSVVVPYGVADGAAAAMQIEYGGFRSETITLPVVPAAPGIFTIDQSGTGQGAILNQDGTVNSHANPAPPGSAVSVYATGGGRTEPPSDDGEIPAGARPLALETAATVGGEPAVVLYAGAAPGLVSGVVQVNILIPGNAVDAGAAPILVTIGGASSQAGVTVSVGGF